jgi:3-dehydroquinate synthase
LLQKDAAALAYAIQRSCEIKAEVVADDEREAGRRAILNFGHTFGHAIETAQGYGAWLHGEAVAAGMMLATDLSSRLGWLTVGDVNDVRQLLQHSRLPVQPPAMSCDQFLSLMARDKKVLDGNLRLVLLTCVGEAIVTSVVTDQQIKATLMAAGVPS